MWHPPVRRAGHTEFCTTGRVSSFQPIPETFTVSQLAELVAQQAKKLGLEVEISHIDNPWVKSEEHYYNPIHTKLPDLGLQSHLLSDVLIESMIKRVEMFEQRIKQTINQPRVKWNGRTEKVEALKMMWAGH